MSFFRRGLILGLFVFLAGCTSRYPANRTAEMLNEEPHRVEVAYDAKYKPGTIIVDTPARRLYYMTSKGKAIRYVVSVGREGHQFRGNAYVGRKADWPTWTPTANMIKTNPYNRKYAGGISGGPHNPLGARALYLYRAGRDTNFRIHGTNQPQSIGYAMSSGCIRMLNSDVIDLYNRVSIGTKVIVLQ